MRLYADLIFPRLCDWLLDRPDIATRRREVVAPAHGEVLEIGFGSGLNLPHYPHSVHKLTALDPNPGMSRLAQRRARHARLAVEFCAGTGECLPFPDARFDCVVSVFTLCSVADIDRVLAEVVRVLRPGGALLFLEHGLSPDPAVQRWQQRLNWLEMRLADGCRLDRPIKALLAAQPFAAVSVEESYLRHVPKTHGYLYRGQARR